MARALRVLGLLAGTALAVILYRQIGPEQLLPQARTLGWSLAAFLAVYVGVYLVETGGWRLSLGFRQGSIKFWPLFVIRAAGEAMNVITPLGGLGGEPVKAYLLTRRGISTADTAASVAIAKTTMTLAQIAFVGCGIIVAMRVLRGAAPMMWGFAAFPGLVLSMILVAAAVTSGVVPTHWRQSVGDRLYAVSWLRPAFSSMGALWNQVAGFYSRNPRAFAASFGLYFLGWSMGALEIFIAVRALGPPLTWSQAFAMEALISSITMATFFIPSNAGSQEAGFYGLAPLFGMDQTTGMVLAGLRRLRQFLWVGIGLLFLLIMEGRLVFAPSEPATEPDEALAGIPAEASPPAGKPTL